MVAILVCVKCIKSKANRKQARAAAGVFLVIFFDNCPDMCLILAKPDHFLVLAALMGLCSAAQICSLKYICLSLGIIAVYYVSFTVKADIQFFVISEITQLD